MNASPSPAAFECYTRTADFEVHAETLELSPALWEVFAQTETRVSVAEVARRLGIETGVAALGLRELAEHKLLRREVQRWRDFRGAGGAATVREVAPAAPAPTPPVVPAVVAAVAPKAVVSPVAPPSPPPSSRAVGSAPAEIRVVLRSLRARPLACAEPAGLIAFSFRRSGFTVRGTAPAIPQAEAPTSWPLRPILAGIVRHGGGGVPGQLLAYRVFLRVPADLLDRAGLHSLSLADADFTIHDPELQDALRRGLREVTGLEIDALRAEASPPLSSPP